MAVQDPSPFPFSYAEFQEWYARLTDQQLEPAARQLSRLVAALLDEKFEEFLRRRMRLVEPRIKSPLRLWNKMQHDKYRPRIQRCDDVPAIIDDLVGLRVVCNNTSDIVALQEVLGGLPPADEAPLDSPLVVEAESERKYHERAKESGYRAYHINVATPVPALDGTRRVRAELQVRTLLQEGWGELTHEDTYKPGAQLPPIAEQLARRMADLLATVDDIAEDIRRELDRSVQATLTDEPEATATDIASAEAGTGGVPTEALVAAVRDSVKGIDKPTSLASIAHEVQRELGTGVTQGWGGFGNFKALLQAACPELRIISQGPSYALPADSTSTDFIDAVQRRPSATPLPGVVIALRELDSSVPDVSGGLMRDLMSGLALALRTETWDELGLDPAQTVGLREVNALTRHARDEAAANGYQIARKDLDYLVKGLLWASVLRPGLPLEEAQSVLAERLAARAAAQGGYQVSEDDMAELRGWLAGLDDPTLPR